MSEQKTITFETIDQCKHYFIGKDSSNYNINLSGKELLFIKDILNKCNILNLSNNKITCIPQRWIPLCNILILSNNCIDNIPTYFKGKIIYNNDTYENINEILKQNKLLSEYEVGCLLKIDIMLLNVYIKTLYSLLNIQNKNEKKKFIENCNKLEKHRKYFDNTYNINKDIFLSNEECIALYLISNNNVNYLVITKLLEYSEDEYNKLMYHIKNKKAFY